MKLMLRLVLEIVMELLVLMAQENQHFSKILSGKQEANSGSIHLESGKRMSVLEQNHNACDEFMVLETVLRGNHPCLPLKPKWIAFMLKKILVMLMGNA